MRVKVQQGFINYFFYVNTAIIIIWRHVNLTIKQTTSMLPFIMVGTVLLVFYIIYSKKKTKIMKIKETKEIEDNARTAKTIIYFYKRFVLIYVILFLLLYYVQFNFKSLTVTMELIAGSLLIGAMLRIDLANRTGL